MVKYPADWKRCKLGSFVRIQRGASPRPIEDYLTLAAQSVNWIKIGDAPKNGKYIISTQERITWEGARHSVHVNLGDFILSNSMSFGRPYILKTNGCIHDGWLRLYDFQNEVDSNFLYYILSSRTVKEQYAALAAGSGVQNLNKKIVKDVEVILPPLEEQKSIANALTAFDTYIEDLTALIAKKKDIRDGALEDLVSGRTRLEGYCGEWKTYQFNEFFKLIPNNTLSRDKLSVKGTVGNIHYGDVLIKFKNILTDADKISRIKDVDFQCNNFLQLNDIVLADTAEDETVGKVVQVGKVSIPLVGGLHTIVCRPMVSTATGFLGYYMNSKSYHDQLLPYITGIKVSAISKKSLNETELILPTDLAEQQAIADTLIAMDEEIQQLEAKRDKMKGIRDGAMDDLLTGRIRLESNEQ